MTHPMHDDADELCDPNVVTVDTDKQGNIETGLWKVNPRKRVEPLDEHSDESTVHDSTKPKRQRLFSQSYSELEEVSYGSLGDTMSGGIDLNSRNIPASQDFATNSEVSTIYMTGKEPSILVNKRTTARETTKPKFNLLDAILEHDDLCLVISSFLPVSSFLTLYAVSKSFYYAVNKHYTAYMLALARYHCPGSEEIFPWRFYRSLCIQDPSAIHHRHLYHNGASGNSANYLVPSLKWVQMVAHREKVVRQIIAILILKGQRLPRGSNPVLKKVWFLQDIPTNSLRVAVAQNRNYLSDRDLLRATITFVKLDMAFSDPISARGQTGARRMLLAQRSLVPLRDVLAARGDARSYMGVVRLLARWWPRASRIRRPGYFGLPESDSEDDSDSDVEEHDSDEGDGERLLGANPLPHGRDSDSQQDAADGGGMFFGVPLKEVGATSFEGFDNGFPYNHIAEPRTLLQPDELVMRESIRRGLQFQRWYTDFIMWGYVDPRTGQEIQAPRVVEELREKWIAYEKMREEMAKGPVKEEMVGEPAKEGMAREPVEEEMVTEPTVGEMATEPVEEESSGPNVVGTVSQQLPLPEA